ncbi:hypothetical protein N7539_001532 [Penicillium diatomitis]|uniref:Uncharacterized protein n=1 Tax=Penicillium diatomitis TaxID=2819901 RepID=A0A9W9XGX1_9EURO|nr:uncharacterized protein N7539_001532 [Penicillium diatomitis]KAJ5492786.1 hypothetical protein N7539_001532 [Penicillium diatomitis]
MAAERFFSRENEQTLPVHSRSQAGPAPTWSGADANLPTGAYASNSTIAHPPPTDLIVSQTDAPVSSSPATVQQPVQPASEDITIVERNVPSKVRKPRKAANASVGKATLFWVNTDADSAATGTKEETLKRIRSHVMSEHNRKKRLESTKKYKGKTWKHLAFQPPETVSDGAVVSRNASLTPSSSSTSTQWESQVSGSSPVTHGVSPTTTSQGHRPSPTTVLENQDLPNGADVSWDEGTQGDEVIQHSSTLLRDSPWSYVGSGANDPFNTGHTQLTDRMMRHLHIFLWDLTQEAHPLQTRYKPKLQAHWAALLQRDPSILHAAICMATSNAAMQRGELPLRDPEQQRSALVVDTFHHRGETIRLVNEGLSDPVKCASDELIASVSMLLTIEIASGNVDYLKIHLAGLRQMVGMRKDFAEVPADVRFQINWTDVRVACMAMTKPIFPFVHCARPQNLTLVPPNDDIAQCATRLLPLLNITGVFSETFSKTIYHFLELCWYAEWVKGGGTTKEFDEETENYFNVEVLSIEYSLHADRYTATGQIKGDNSIEGCTRLACLCFHTMYMWGFYPLLAPLMPKPILALRAALEATIPTGLFALCRDLLIWLLFIGAASSQVMPQERAYFVEELAKAAKLYNVHTWQECRTILLGFFYVDRVLLVILRQVWHEVERTMDTALEEPC